MGVEGEDRARVVAAYRAKLGRAVKGYFNRIPNPAGHPVLQTEPLPGRDEPAARKGPPKIRSSLDRQPVRDAVGLTLVERQANGT